MAIDTIARHTGSATPVFICGHSRGGTTLLTTLLDSHPALAVLPGETQYFQRYFLRRKFTRVVLKVSQLLGLGGIKEVLFKFPFTMLSSESPRRAKIIIEKWTDYFPSKNDASDEIQIEFLDNDSHRGNYWDSYLSVYEQLSGVDIETKKCWIEKTPFNEKFVFLTEKMFETSPKYLHVLRDPRSVISSLLNYEHEGFTREQQIFRLCYSWARSVKDGLGNSKSCAGRYLFIRYEDLVLSTQDEMSKIQDFLEVESDDSVLQPSRLGSPYRINSSYSEDMYKKSGVVRTQIDRYKVKLSASEVRYIEGTLGPIMQWCGYQEADANSLRGESAQNATDANSLTVPSGFNFRLMERDLSKIRVRFENQSLSSFQPSYSSAGS